MHYYESECCAKRMICCFKVEVTSRAHMIKIWQFLLYLWTACPFATKLGLKVHYHKPECFMEKLDCCVQGQGHSKISKCHDIFWIAEPFSTKLGMMMHLWWGWVVGVAVSQPRAQANETTAGSVQQQQDFIFADQTNMKTTDTHSQTYTVNAGHKESKQTVQSICSSKQPNQQNLFPWPSSTAGSLQLHNQLNQIKCQMKA